MNPGPSSRWMRWRRCRRICDICPDVLSNSSVVIVETKGLVDYDVVFVDEAGFSLPP